MRHALAALVAATLACSAEPLPSCGAPGLGRACPCPGGAQGAQECGLGGAWTACVCPDGGALEAGVDGGADAGPMDAAGEAGADGAAEAGPDAAADVAPEAVACPAGFGDCDERPGCETNLTSLQNCGGCGRACPSGGGYRCCPTSEVNRCPRADLPCS